MEQGMENRPKETAADEALRRPPVRIGIAGLGRAAMRSHIPTLEKCSGLFSITAVCDLKKDRRDIIERNHPDVHTYRRLDDMLDDPDVEAFLISLPTTMHQQATLEVLSRDRWAVVETPLAISHDDALVLRAASIKARGKLIPYVPGLFAPDYRLTLMALDDPRLGDLYEVKIRRQDYIRRDDWQAIKRCGGGAVNHTAQDALMQAAGLLRSQPSQLWSELRRIAALGDAEDFAHIILKTRGAATADIEINGGALPPFEPAFTLRGLRGSFSVAADASCGTFHTIDPAFKFPRRRPGVGTPPLDGLHEQPPLQDAPLSLPAGCETGCAAFWRAAHAAMRTAAPPPVSIDDAVEAIRFMHLVKRSSPFVN